jgi:hypothetical protein
MSPRADQVSCRESTYARLHAPQSPALVTTCVAADWRPGQLYATEISTHRLCSMIQYLYRISLTRYLYHIAVKLHRQYRCQHDSIFISHRDQVVSTAPSSTGLGARRILSWLAIRLRCLSLISLWGLRSTTPIDGPTWIHCYLHCGPRLEASVSWPQWYGTLRQIS